jgi:tetratricopeptide (TPR) repeat protein
MVAFLLPRGRLRTLGTAAAGVLALSVLVWRFISQPDLLAWYRVSIWRAVLEIWARRPITGVGPGSLVEAAGVERILHSDQVGRYQFVVSYAESTPLAVLVQLGLVGLGLAVVAAVLWLLAARSAGALDQPAVRAALAGAAVFALFHDLLTADPVLWWWAVLAGAVERPLDVAGVAATERASAGVRWLLGLAMAWLTAWGLLAPAHARVLWRGSPATADAVERVLRVEPWFDEAPAGRVVELLAATDRWSWTDAAEALHWAEVARRTHPGLARRWADVGRVRIRIVTDLGGTRHDVEAAERALDRACALDPHLPWTWLERARLARIVGEHEVAIQFTRRALDEEPNTVRGWLLLARLHADLGRVDAARHALVEAGRRETLAGRAGLSDYEMELLEALPDEASGLERALGVAPKAVNPDLLDSP